MLWSLPVIYIFPINEPNHLTLVDTLSFNKMAGYYIYNTNLHFSCVTRPGYTTPNKIITSIPKTTKPLSQPQLQTATSNNDHGRLPNQNLHLVRHGRPPIPQRQRPPQLPNHKRTPHQPSRQPPLQHRPHSPHACPLHLPPSPPSSRCPHVDDKSYQSDQHARSNARNASLCVGTMVP